MKERIVSQTVGPALAEVGALDRVLVETPKRRLAAACRFEMNDTREWRPQGGESEFIEPQAKVYVVVFHRETSIKPAGGREFRPLYGKTRSGNRRCLVQDKIAAEPARLAIAAPGIEMPSALANPEDHTGVLDSPVRIKELAADSANLRVDRPFGKLAEPFGLDDFHVVIQENKDIAPRLCGAEIVQGGVIERLGSMQQRDALVRCDRSKQAESPRIGAAIVDDDEIELREPGFLQNTGNRPAQKIRIVARHHHDCHACFLRPRRARIGCRGYGLLFAASLSRLHEKTPDMANVSTPQTAEDVLDKAGLKDRDFRQANPVARVAKPSQHQSPNIWP